MSNNLITATELAKICQVTPRTIRWYQKLGILTPKKVDKWNKYAYFAPEQSLEVFKTKLLQQMDLPLKKMHQPAVSLNEQVKQLETFIKTKLAETKFLKKISRILEEQDIDQLLKKRVVGSYQLFCLKIDQGDYHQIDAYLNQVKAKAKQVGLKVIGDGMVFYLDQELKYQPKNTPLEAAFIVKSQKEAKLDGFYFRTLPKQSVLAHEFKTSSPHLQYLYLPLIYKKIDQLISKNKIKISQPVFEIYSKNSTTICYPI